MGDQDSGSEPSLELPSFGLGRKRRKNKDSPPPPPVSEQPSVEAEDDAVGEVDDSVVEPVVDARPTVGPTVEPVPRAEPVVQPVQPVPAVSPPPAPTPAPSADEDGEPAPAGRTRRPRRQRRPRRAREKTPREPREPREPRVRRERHLPPVSGPVAAVVTGIVVGLVTVLLTGLSLRLCETVKGTSSCGGPGFLLLVAILVLVTYLGGWMLRAWRLIDPLSTSFLAVGLMAVVAMLFLVEVMFEWWMIIAIPLVAAGTYTLSWWVTTSFVDVD